MRSRLRILDHYLERAAVRLDRRVREGRARADAGGRDAGRSATRRRRATPRRGRRCRSRNTPARTVTRWYGDITIAEKRRQARDAVLAHAVARPATLEHWQHDTFIVRWRDRELRADAYVTFALNPDGSIDQAKMSAVSPATDFSFDFQDLLLKPVGR